MEQQETVANHNDELVSSYFELDQASIPYSDDQGGYGDLGRFDEKISGFEPIENRRNNMKVFEQNTKVNFSGGVGCYLWPWSSQVPYSQSLSTEEVRKELGIDEQEVRMQERAINAFLAVELNTNGNSLLPSQSSGIDWKRELLQVYQPK
ncbi:hypothetical protein F5B19DRAFT_461564 [Rostrohypoxylon terebratum]|nr:hypothetical protein F5B19DRAFT_461564 [Rostrohypoxylon terebratum]